MHFPPPGREQLPRISHQAREEGQLGLDNALASNPCRDAFVSTSSKRSQTPAQAPY